MFWRGNTDKPVIIARLQGGLGNQMFQYAAGRALALRLTAELKLDLAWFGSIAEGDTPRSYMLDAFPDIQAITAEQRECERLLYARRGLRDFLPGRPRRPAASYVVEPQFDYWEDFKRLDAPAYLSGYWQNELYFACVADIIRRDFAFPPLPGGAAREAGERIRSTRNATAVHVRRGDYASNPITGSYHGLCPPEYYSKALDAIAAHAGAAPELFLFSDDPDWVREHFDTRGFPATVIDGIAHKGAPWHDMHLMSLCKHHTIANSSFSWWGAWLADNGGLICAPRRWFAEPGKERDNPAAVSWVRL